MSEKFEFEPIAYLRSPFKEKFGIPRQAGLAAAARAVVRMQPGFADPAAFEELAGFTHIWLVYVFHEHVGEGWQARVRPPRLGGNRRVGVFASRSPYRPNPIGISVVRLESVERQGEGVALQVSGVDLLDGTPILDIKPYIPYSDAIADADGHFASPPGGGKVRVHFTETAARRCHELETVAHPSLCTLIEQVLQQDPRPAYRTDQEDDRGYGFRLYDLNIRFHAEDDVLVVDAIEAWRE